MPPSKARIIILKYLTVELNYGNNATNAASNIIIVIMTRANRVGLLT